MDLYNVIISPTAKEQLKRYIDYIQYDLLSGEVVSGEYESLRKSPMMWKNHRSIWQPADSAEFQGSDSGTRPGLQRKYQLWRINTRTSDRSIVFSLISQLILSL